MVSRTFWIPDQVRNDGKMNYSKVSHTDIANKVSRMCVHLFTGHDHHNNLRRSAAGVKTAFGETFNNGRAIAALSLFVYI